MKLHKSIVLFAVTAMAFTGCANNLEEVTPPVNGEGTPITVRANVALEAGTRASLEVGESSFTGKWESGDALVLEAKTTTAPASTEVIKLTYDGTDFKGTLKSKTHGDWTYRAAYPFVEGTTSTSIEMPFGAMRTQKGSNFNSAYDALIADSKLCTDADPGVNSDGTSLDMKLNRLTSILHFDLGSDAAAVAGQKVKSVTVIADKTIAAPTLNFNYNMDGEFDYTKADIKLADMGGSLAITMTYDAGTEPDVNAFKAFFNILPGTYTLRIDVQTLNNKVATFNVNRTKPFVAGMMYTKKATLTDWQDPTAPTADWVGHDIEQRYVITPELKVPIVINAQSGIQSFTIDIESPILNDLLGMVGLAKHMDFINPATPAMGDMLGSLGFPVGAAITNSTTQSFDISSFMNLILMVAGGQPSSDTDFTFNIVDNAGRTLVKTIKLRYVAPITHNSASTDLWKNTTTFTLANPGAGKTPSVLYKKSSETTWQTATVVANGDSYTATIAPEWTTSKNAAGLDIHTPNTATGIFAGNTYNYKLVVDGADVSEGEFSAANGDVIPDGDMEDSTLPCFTQKGSETTSFWGSGNQSMATLCIQNTDGSNHRGRLQSKKVGILAAGNLFTGTFKFASLAGTVSFGQKYTYTARPTALDLKYWAQVGIVDCKSGKRGPLVTGDQDKARIFVCIIDWNARHNVKSGMSTTEGAWDPETTKELPEGKIIGYGSMWIDATTTGDAMQNVKLPIHYYDKDAQPSAGNYSIIISSAASAYGDFMNGCSTNFMYVDDFNWIY